MLRENFPGGIGAEDPGGKPDLLTRFAAFTHPLHEWTSCFYPRMYFSPLGMPSIVSLLPPP
jgi:hypothetical protein